MPLAHGIERLPMEILQEIFKQCTTPEDFFQNFHYVNTRIPLPEPSFKDPPLLLTRVSTQWKSAAISFPDLWSSIRLCDTSCNVGTLTSFCTMLEEWLRNSGNRPLNIVLHDPRWDANPIWRDIIPIVSKHAHHCHTLIASPTLAKRIFDQHKDMPMLRRFWSRSFTYNLAVDGLHIPPGVHVTELCSLHLEHYSLLPRDGALKLRNLDLITCKNITDIIGMLRHFSELRTFRFKICLNEEPGTDEITHHHIEELAVQTTVFAPEVAQRLHFPKLRILRAWGMWFPARLQDLMTWLDKSGYYLDMLELTGGMEGEMTAEEVDEMFKPKARVRRVEFEKP